MNFLSSIGKLLFEFSSTFNGAISGYTLFVDGYVSTKSNNYFELTTGQLSSYAPIGVTIAAVTNGVAAAYYSSILVSTAKEATIST